MRILPVFLLALALPCAAHAQMYKWVDKDGKTRYGDTPPPGVKASALKGISSAPSASAPASAGAKKAPLTPAEQEMEYRKRRDEAKKASERADEESQAQAAKSEGCEQAKEYLRTLESGQRIARTNASGERYYLNEDQVAQDVVKARQSLQQACK